MRSAATPVPCELAVKVVIPSLRALVAKELRQSYSMKQEEIAAALGVTQSAVSQYIRSVRGRTLDLGGLEEIGRIVAETAGSISRDDAGAAYVNRKYCEACKVIRESRLLCALHRRFDPAFDIEDCGSCLPSNTPCW